MRAHGSGFAAALAGSLLFACAGQSPRALVAPRDLPEARGAPRIESVTDLGGLDVPTAGRLAEVEPDGRVVVGETLWIRGARLGRQPTVRIADEPALLLGRTADGGILARVPAGTPAGRQELAVSHREGESRVEITVRRHAVLAAPAGERLLWLEVDPDGARPAGGTAHAATTHLTASHDGRAAFLAAAEGGTLDVVDLAQGAARPAPVFRLELGPGRNHALVAAARAPVLALVRDRQVQLFATDSALRPARRAPLGLPVGLAGEQVQAAALSPDGALLALALRDSDRVELLRADRSERGRLVRAGAVALDSGAPGPGLFGLRFTSGRGARAPERGDVELLWVLSGERADNQGVGPRPTRLHAIRIDRGAGAEVDARLAHVVDLPFAARPRALALGSHPLQSGAAIRVPPEEVAVLVAAAVRGETGAPARDALYLVGPAFGAGAAVEELASVPGVVLALEVEPEGRWALAAFVSEAGPLRLLQARADGRAFTPRTIDLDGGGGARPSSVTPPSSPILIQP